MENNFKKIETAVESVRNRRKTIRFFGVAALTTAIVGVLLLIAILALPALFGAPKLFFRLVLLAAMLSSFGWAAYLLIKSRENIDQTARAIERANKRLKNELINALQLIKAKNEGGTKGAFSDTLLQKHIESTNKSLEDIDFDSPAKWGHAKRKFIFCAIASLVLVTVFLASPDRSSRGLSALLTDNFTIEKETEIVKTLPLTVGDFNIKYVFPAYSMIGPQNMTHTNGDIAALKGTAVTIETRSLEPLKEASIVTSGGARYAMDIKDKTRLKVDLVLLEEGSYFIEGTRTQKEKRAEPRSHKITIDEDLAPSVMLLLPASDLEVAAEASLDISYEATDDFGLSETALVYKYKGKEERIVIHTIREEGEKRFKDDYEWSLFEMKFAPGERIPFHIEVVDNDEVAGGKTGISDSRVLTIFSARNEHRRLLIRQDEMLDRMIDHLALHLTAKMNDRDGAQFLKSETGLLENGEKLVGFIDALYADLLEDEYAEELMLDTLADILIRYPENFAHRDKILSGKNKILIEKDISKLILQRELFQADIENDILFIDKLIKKQRIDDLLLEADDLYRAQADLADLLEQYKRTGDPELLDQLMEAMSEIQAAFDSIMRRMAEARKGLPEEFINSDAMDEGHMSSLQSEMEKLKKALADGDIESAMKMADDFLSKMNDWMAALEESAGEMGDMMSQEIMAKLSEISDELDDLILRQSTIEDEIQSIYEEALNKKIDQEAVDSLKDEIRQDLKNFKSEMVGARNAFNRLRPKMDAGKPQALTIEYYKKRNELNMPFSQMQRDSDSIMKLMDENEISAALEKAEKIKQKLEEQKMDAGQFNEKYKTGPKDKKQQMNSSCENGGGDISSAIEKLKKLGDEMSSSPGEEAQAALKGLSGFQDALKQDTKQVMEKYDELKAEAASLPGEISKHLGEAGQQMQGSSSQMQKGMPGKAIVPARNARKHLEQAKGGLQKSQGEMMQSMMGMSGSGGMPRPKKGQGGENGLSSGEVEMPDENAYKVPGKFREELLKAMNEDSPDAYKNLNKDYYERLVR